MVEDLFRSQLEVSKEDIEPVIVVGLYNYRDFIGSQNALVKVIK